VIRDQPHALSREGREAHFLEPVDAEFDGAGRGEEEGEDGEEDEAEQHGRDR
jgi:hypothetical protein